MRIKEIVKAVSGKFSGDNLETEVCAVSTDSRQELSGKLFVALKGDNFDGHDYINKAFENGAACVLCERGADLGKPFISVNSTHQALKDLAEYYISRFKIPVVAITGSVGKTTTKDMIASVLSQKYKVLKSEGNFNNEIGLPLTVFNLNESHECAVFEMGMNHFGEIHNLSKIVKPNICIITNIGVSHIEYLGSREGILKAKCEIFDFMDGNGCKILNGDDDFLRTITGNTLFYGLNNDNAIYADCIEHNGISGITANINYNGESFRVKISQPGIHIVQNALAAAAAGFKLGLNADEIKTGIENFKPSKMRMNILKPDNGLIILDDAYNANPVSSKAALDVLSTAETRKVCILADMLELGQFAEEMHRDLGRYASQKQIDLIICVGELGRYIYEGAYEIANTIIKYYNRQDFLLHELDELIKAGDTILVKASRGLHLEKTVYKLSELKIERG